MTNLKWVFLLCFIGFSYMQAQLKVEFINGQYHKKGLIQIVSEVEHSRGFYNPFYLRQRFVFVQDTFLFINKESTALDIQSVQHIDTNWIRFTQRVAPGDTCEIYYSRRFSQYMLSVDIIQDSFSLMSSLGEISQFKVDYQLMGFHRMMPVFQKSAVVGYSYKSHPLSHFETYYYIGEDKQLQSSGKYHRNLQKRIGKWEIYKDKVKFKDTVYSEKCLTLYVYKSPFEKAKLYNVKVFSKGKWVEPEMSVDAYKADVLFLPHYDSLLVFVNDSFDKIAINYQASLDWNEQAFIMLLQSEKERRAYQKSLHLNQAFSSDRFLMSMEEPYKRENFVLEAKKNYKFNFQEVKDFNLFFNRKSFGSAVLKKIEKDWKVSSISPELDTSVYLINHLFIANLNDKEKYSLDTMMLSNGFIRAYYMTDFVAYKSKEKLLKVSMIGFYIRLLQTFPNARITPIIQLVSN